LSDDLSGNIDLISDQAVLEAACKRLAEGEFYGRIASMNTEAALAQLGVSVADLTTEQRRKFDEDGYFVVEDVFNPAEVAEMRSEFDRLRSIEGEFGGHEVHIEPGAPRLSNLFNKSPAFDRCLSCKPTLAAGRRRKPSARASTRRARVSARWPAALRAEWRSSVRRRASS